MSMMTSAVFDHVTSTGDGSAESWLLRRIDVSPGYTGDCCKAYAIVYNDKNGRWIL